MPLDDRLRQELPGLLEPGDLGGPDQGALESARRRGASLRRRRRLARGGAVAAAAVVLAVGTWQVIDRSADEGDTIIADQRDDAGPPDRPGDGNEPISTSPVSGWVSPLAIWNGSEVLIWEGPVGDDGEPAAASYDPATASWRTVDIDYPREVDSAAVWTGSEIFATGTSHRCVPPMPCPQSAPMLHRLSSMGAPLGESVEVPSPERSQPELLWADGRVILWGGFVCCDADLGEPSGAGDGAIYDPVTDTWEPIPENPFGQRGTAITAFHDGSLVVGAGEGGTDSDRGWYRYTVATGEWSEIADPPTNFDLNSSGVQVGDRLVVWNGTSLSSTGGPAAVLDLTSGTWRSLNGPAGSPMAAGAVSIGDRAVFVDPVIGALMIHDLDVDGWVIVERPELVGARVLVQAGPNDVMALNATSGSYVILPAGTIDIVPSTFSSDPEPTPTPDPVEPTPQDTLVPFGGFVEPCSASVLTNDVDDNQVLADGLACFLDAVETSTPVVWDLAVATVEGDPILHRYDFDGTATTITVDTTRDTFGAPTVDVQRCANVIDGRFLPEGTECERLPNGQPFEIVEGLWPF